MCLLVVLLCSAPQEVGRMKCTLSSGYREALAWLRSLHLPHPLPPLQDAPQDSILAGSSYHGEGMSVGFPSRLFLQEPLRLASHHQSLADASQKPSKEALGPPSAQNLLLPGRSPAGGERAGLGLSALPLATELSGPSGLPSCLDVPKAPGMKCFLRTWDKDKDVRPNRWHLLELLTPGTFLPRSSVESSHRTRGGYHFCDGRDNLLLVTQSSHSYAHHRDGL